MILAILIYILVLLNSNKFDINFKLIICLECGKGCIILV